MSKIQSHKLRTIIVDLYIADIIGSACKWLTTCKLTIWSASKVMCDIGYLLGLEIEWTSVMLDEERCGLRVCMRQGLQSG